MSPNAAAFLNEQGMVLDDAMIAEFNEKNRIQHELVPAFVKAHAGFQLRDDGSDSIKLSRPGLDLQRKKAIVCSRSAHIQQKAFYQEDNFILLEYSEGPWLIKKVGMAGQRYY
jgi:hypothetical protein